MIDYSPKVDYKERLKAISQSFEKPPEDQNDTKLAVLGHPIRRNPIFAHLFPNREQSDSLALTRMLTNYEEAIGFQSPQGLLVHGEVGSGKSMLVDLLADGLPTQKKRKWHFNTFMLETFAKLEQLRRRRAQLGFEKDTSEHSLLWLAKDMIETSPVLFLDEFQLPDKVASKIISQLLTAFFQLGGVLIATSNRMPDELSKSSGVDFATFSTRELTTSRSRLAIKSCMSILSNSKNGESASFIEVLKARCEIWNMEGGRDWRRREAEEMATRITQTAAKNETKELASDFLPSENTTILQDTSKIKDSATHSTANPSIVLPHKYYLNSSTSDEAWLDILKSELNSNTQGPISWESLTVVVYAREVFVPCHLNGITYWNFSDLCERNLGPADYITLASKFHTFVLNKVPVLSLNQKNEARRLITLLDALYESRCKLILRAEAGPDDLFFPELTRPLGNSSLGTRNDDRDSVYSETIAEIYQSKTSPFRPNISAYMEGNQTSPEPGIDPNLTSAAGTDKEIGRQVDFSKTSSFIGQDERFAYKRARSRLWEMCGNRWHSRSEQNWWKPLPADVRSWEHSNLSRSKNPKAPSVDSDIKIGEFFELDRPAGLQGLAIEERNSRT